MDTDLVHLLANMGGLGVLAGILFYLHLTGMKTFREELAAERRQCHEDHLAIQQAIRPLVFARPRGDNRRTMSKPSEPSHDRLSLHALRPAHAGPRPARRPARPLPELQAR
jgi:hypothetical protein